jgi:quercetin dioxygenase-like cupin family protein
MTRTRRHFPVLAPLLFVCVGMPIASAYAQAQGFAPKVHLRSALTGDDTKEAVVASAEFAPGGTTGRHSHPWADEYALVLEGTLELRVEGREPRRVNSGEAYHTTRGVIHETRNVGGSIARAATTFVVDKGKPLTQPAP